MVYGREKHRWEIGDREDWRTNVGGPTSDQREPLKTAERKSVTQENTTRKRSISRPNSMCVPHKVPSTGDLKALHQGTLTGNLRTHRQVKRY